MSDPNNRRGFIGTILGSVTAFGLATILAPVKAQAEINTSDSALPAEGLFKNLKGKHKIVFDTIAYRGGSVLGWAHAFLKTNNETGTDDKDLNVVIVLRSAPIGMGLNDVIWEKYKLGEIYKVDDPEAKAPSLRNIFTVPDKEDPGMSIAELQARGVLFCVCSIALEGNAEHIADKMSLKKEDVHKDFLANLIPGIHLMPSGVWALGRAQEKGCAYCSCG